MAALLIFLKLVVVSTIAGEINPMHNICGQYIEEISIQTNVPPEVLWSVARAESNLPNRGPWPWSLNIEGKSYYFKTHRNMIKFIEKRIKNKNYTRVSIDVGCMQINSFYHGHKFTDIYEMTNIYKNMLVGARYLRHLYEIKKRQFKNKSLPENRLWGYAVGDYHSKTNRRGASYIINAAKFLMTHPSWHDGILTEPDWTE